MLDPDPGSRFGVSFSSTDRRDDKKEKPHRLTGLVGFAARDDYLARGLQIFHHRHNDGQRLIAGDKAGILAGFLGPSDRHAHWADRIIDRGRENDICIIAQVITQLYQWCLILPNRSPQDDLGD